MNYRNSQKVFPYLLSVYFLGCRRSFNGLLLVTFCELRGAARIAYFARSEQKK